MRERWFPCRIGWQTDGPGYHIGGEIGIVVDLAVEHDCNGAIFIEDRLLSAAEIDDAETAMAQTGVSIDKVTVIIWTAVRLSRSHAFDQLPVDVVSYVEIDDPANPAHIPFPVLLFR